MTVENGQHAITHVHLRMRMYLCIQKELSRATESLHKGKNFTLLLAVCRTIEPADGHLIMIRRINHYHMHALVVAPDLDRAFAQDHMPLVVSESMSETKIIILGAQLTTIIREMVGWDMNCLSEVLLVHIIVVVGEGLDVMDQRESATRDVRRDEVARAFSCKVLEALGVQSLYEHLILLEVMLNEVMC